jgi:hypothetical protein
VPYISLKRGSVECFLVFAGFSLIRCYVSDFSLDTSFADTDDGAREKRKRSKPATESAALALALPEIRSAIFEQLEAPVLFAAVCICHAWASTGLRLLWRDVPLEVLELRPCFDGYDYDITVRRLYINMEVDELPATLNRWNLTQLQHLSLHPRVPHNFAWPTLQLLKRYGPTLRYVAIPCSIHNVAVGFYNAILADIFLLLARCKNLVSLRIDDGIGGAATGIKFFEELIAAPAHCTSPAFGIWHLT